MCAEFISECLNLQTKQDKIASLQFFYVRDNESQLRLVHPNRIHKLRGFPGSCAEGEAPGVCAEPVRRRAEERKSGGGAEPGPGSGRGRGCWLRRGDRSAASPGPARAQSPRPRETPGEAEGLGVPEQSPLAAAALLPVHRGRRRPRRLRTRP